MAKLNFSTKRLMISKANSTMVVVTAVAAFVTAFSLVTSRALLSQRSFQSRVIAEKEAAADQLVQNLAAVDSLQQAYQAFVSAPQNAIGGSPDGEADNDGDNAKIVLDALPSKYDFPALASSLEKILVERNFAIDSITGTDDAIAQAGNLSSPVPEPIEIPFEVAVTSNYDSLKALTQVLERSIRPFSITALSFSGSDADVQLTITAKTYYQPEKNLTITTKEIE